MTQTMEMEVRGTQATGRPRMRRMDKRHDTNKCGLEEETAQGRRRWRRMVHSIAGQQRRSVYKCVCVCACLSAWKKVRIHICEQSQMSEHCRGYAAMTTPLSHPIIVVVDIFYLQHIIWYRKDVIKKEH